MPQLQCCEKSFVALKVFLLFFFFFSFLFCQTYMFKIHPSVIYTSLSLQGHMGVLVPISSGHWGKVRVYPGQIAGTRTGTRTTMYT